MQTTYIVHALLIIATVAHGIEGSRSKRTSEFEEEASLLAPDLVRKYGYPCETHEVTTEDGYILQVHRVPHGRKRSNATRNRMPVIVQHGLLGSSTDFLLLGPDSALVYYLADEGFDVWMPNSRGNMYSRQHVTYDPDRDSDYWRFSYHELGVYDVPAVIDYVLKKTRRKRLFHVGHSQGTTSFFVMGAERPEYNDKVIAHFSYAPSAYEKHMRSLALQVVGKMSNVLAPLAQLIGINEFVPGYEFVKMVTPRVCAEDVGLQEVCTNVAFVSMGFNKKELNYTILPTLLGHFPCGSSTEQLLHYGQAILSGRFRQYDRGPIENLARFNSPTPPDYDTSKIAAPLYFFYSEGDLITDYRDVETLANEVPNLKELIKVDDLEWSHLDYAIGISAKEKLYKRTAAFMKKLAN